MVNDIRERAAALGFDALGIAPAQLPQATGEKLTTFLQEKRHGDMAWLETRAQERAQPQSLWPDARSVIVLGANYGPDRNPLDILQEPRAGAISVYAQNKDYHDVIKTRLKALARFIADKAGGDVKVFVDTAPVMEKPLAGLAGLGWQGKHTNLVSDDYGSWLFLGAIFTTLTLPVDTPDIDHCGSCRACLDVCPTNAFPAPYQLDARRCISYLTIEHRGPIPHEFREAMGNRIYGCDDCLAVCPWNKFAEKSRESAFQARDDLRAPSLSDLADLDDAAFRALFTKSPIKRTGRDRFLRNVMIALGNSRDPSLLDKVRTRLTDDSPLVRGAAVWAFAKLSEPVEFEHAAQQNAPAEDDESVLQEWSAGRIMSQRQGST
ncbi:MAG: tRNA epoxyqueuosine(34) reductase QueG [Pseudomonadota bacterium]